jgi:hypothetical protein
LCPTCATLFLDAVCVRRYAEESLLALERTEAIVLRGVDFSETSRIVTFLTPERGRLACMAKGLRRAKSELAGLLDTFHRVELVYHWKDSRSVHPLREVSLLDGYGAIKKDLEKATYGALALEVAYKTAHEDEPSEELYRVLVDGLAQLAASSSGAIGPVTWLLFRLLSAAGFEPRVNDGRGFSNASGMTDGGERADVGLSVEAVADLQRIAAAREMPPPLHAEQETFRVLSRYAEHQLAARFRSLGVIQQIFG